jgi:heterogeneous nuclear ribonucleoprotein F/H
VRPWGATVLQAVRTDGTTVKMRGLPFRASVEEIQQFFKGYGYVAGSLHLGTDSRGRPSGEGWITFKSVDEAGRCVKERNRQYLGSRYLELSIC